MSTPVVPPELVEHLCRHSQLAPTDAARLVREVLAYYAESSEEFIRRRHLDLQAEGLNNSTIFTQIHAELPNRRFPIGPISARQIRRTIYG